MPRVNRNGNQFSLGGGRGGGYYAQPQNPLGRIITLGLILLGLAAVVWLLVARMCASDSCSTFYCASDKKVSPPDGYELVSKLFKATGASDESREFLATFQLTKKVDDGSTLSFYAYNEESKSWEPLAAAVLDERGKEATAKLSGAPPYLAVLRRNRPGGQLIGYLGHNQSLHPDAASAVTLVHTIDFAPNADGSLGGEPSGIKPAGFDWYPTVAANASTKGDKIVDGILAKSESRTDHVQAITKKAHDQNLKGIDIAYLDLNVTHRSSFTLFVSELAQSLHDKNENRRLTLTLPPPLKTANGIDEGAYDYAELARYADLIQITPYREQDKYRLVMPEILAHLTGAVPPAKLVMTVTPYATEKSASSIATMKLTDAMTIATRLSVKGEAPTTGANVEVFGVNIDRTENLTGGVKWVPEAACVAFTYKESGGTGSRTVWIENAFSVAFKLTYAAEYKLGGVAVEDASDNQFLGNIWPAVLAFTTTGENSLSQPNANSLKPEWKASKGDFEDTGRGYIRWTAPPDPGTYTVYLTLSDGVARFQNKVDIVVKPRELKTPTGGTPTAVPTQGR